MRTTKTIHVISAHAEGEVGDVIVGGVTAPARGHASGISRAVGSLEDERAARISC